MLVIAGYFGAVLMGVLQGLLGGGGSVLAVPILVYIFHTSASLATTYSLFTVGVTSLIGAFSHILRGNIRLKSTVLFVVPSLLAVIISRQVVHPKLPKILLKIGGLTLYKDDLILTAFGVLMVVSGLSMIRGARRQKALEVKFGPLMAAATSIGFMTGFVGAGGGFLIVPTLIVLMGYGVREAVGTALLIASANSLVGFLFSFGLGTHLNWNFLSRFSLFAVCGVLIGLNLNRLIPPSKLRPLFGWFVLFMGFVIIARQALNLF